MAPAPNGKRALRAMQRAIARDRLWFFRHPHALVRFRPGRPGEFAALHATGAEPPDYLPPGMDPATPRHWVAVVDLTRLLDRHALSRPLAGSPKPLEGTLRARIRTVPIRSKRMQAMVAQGLLEGVLSELQQLTAQDLPATAG